jgi:hypothetical protein
LTPVLQGTLDEIMWKILRKKWTAMTSTLDGVAESLDATNSVSPAAFSDSSVHIKSTPFSVPDQEIIDQEIIDQDTRQQTASTSDENGNKTKPTSDMRPSTHMRPSSDMRSSSDMRPSSDMRHYLLSSSSSAANKPTVFASTFGKCYGSTKSGNLAIDTDDFHYEHGNQQKRRQRFPDYSTSKRFKASDEDEEKEEDEEEEEEEGISKLQSLRKAFKKDTQKLDIFDD